MVMLDASNTQSEDDIQGRSRPVAGKYHVAIQHAVEKASKHKATPGVEIEFQVVCDGITADGKDTTVGQAGKTMPLFLSYLSEKGDDATKACIDRVVRLALCIGLIKAGEAKEPDWAEAMGRELVIEIVEGEFENKSGQKQKGSDVAFFGFWSLGNKHVANVPKDPQSPGMIQLAKQGGPVQHPTAGPTGGQAATATTTATAGAATAAGTASATRRKYANL